LRVLNYSKPEQGTSKGDHQAKPMSAVLVGGGWGDTG
jgi:hypothetical protein